MLTGVYLQVCAGVDHPAPLTTPSPNHSPAKAYLYSPAKIKFNVFNIVVFYSPAKALFLLSFILLQKDVFNIPLLLQKISLTVLSFVKSSAKL